MLVHVFMVLLSICVSFLAIAVGLYVFCKFTMGKCSNRNSLCGKTILITGGSSGIGLEAVTEFARRGARLIMACRGLERASRAIEEIQRRTGNADVELRQVDTSLLASVEQLAEGLISSETKIDILCLHAGTGPVDTRRETAEGLELTFATNYLGHFHLAQLLRPALNAGARIIITTSMAHEYVRLNLKDLQHRESYSGGLCFARSKLMNVYHMRELARRLQHDGVTVNAHNPGLVHTSLLKNSVVPGDWLTEKLIAPLYAKSAWQGAQTLIHLATSEKVNDVTGCLFRDCKQRRLNGVANDQRMPRNLWEYSERLIRNSSRNKHS